MQFSSTGAQGSRCSVGGFVLDLKEEDSTLCLLFFQNTIKSLLAKDFNPGSFGNLCFSCCFINCYVKKSNNDFQHLIACQMKTGSKSQAKPKLICVPDYCGA